MKYFRINEIDASGCGYDFWTYYALSDNTTLEYAEEIFEEENPWVTELDARRRRSEEITEQQYKTGLVFNKLYQYDHLLDIARKKWNLYESKDLAEMFCDKQHKSGYVRIGSPMIHNVYKINQDGNFIFQYHYNYHVLQMMPL